MTQPSEKKIFFVFASQRSGTTALRSCLNSSGSFFEYGEIFYPSLFSGGYYKEYAEAINRDPSLVLPKNKRTFFLDFVEMRIRERSEPAVGFDIKYSHLDENPEVVRAAAKTGGTAIHLVRENFLESFVSHRLMELRVEKGIIDSKSVHGSKVPEAVQFDIDTSTIADELRRRRTRVEAVHNTLARRFTKVVYIKYESLFQNTPPTTRLSDEVQHLISESVGQKFDKTPQTELVKQNPYGTYNIVRNYAEVSAALSKTEFAHMAR
ncbi:hypothetical protein ACW9UR_00085 [Halovulum sp. GXIMD14794]